MTPFSEFHSAKSTNGGKKHTTREHGCSLGGCRGGNFLCIHGIY